MEKTYHTIIHSHPIIVNSSNTTSFKNWECAGQKIGSKVNPNGCKSVVLGELKIKNPQVVKLTCSQKCNNFAICEPCAIQLSEAAIIPTKVISHPLHSQHSLTRSYELECDWECDAGDFLGCINEIQDPKPVNKTTSKAHYQHRFQCSTCNFDLCLKCLCYYGDNPQLCDLYKVNTKYHTHPLVREFSKVGWNCDGQKSPQVQCVGENITNQSINRWRCEQCDYDLCQNCLKASITDACPFSEPPTRDTFTKSNKIQHINSNEKISSKFMFK